MGKRGLIILITVFLLLAGIFLGGCQNPQTTGAAVTEPQLIDLDTEADGNIRIAFDSQWLEDALMIAGDAQSDKGAIWFETSAGKSWLRGEPDSENTVGNNYLATWQMERGRQIIMAVAKKGANYDVTLNSRGNGEILRWGINLKAKNNEYFTGLIERTVDGHQNKSWRKGVSVGMNLRGEEVRMMVSPTLSLYAPFYLSSRGYGLFVRGTWPGKYDMCKEIDDLVQIEFAGPSLSFKIYTAKTPAKIVQDHTLETGPPVLPPKWAFEPYRWRDTHNNRDDYYDGTKCDAPYNSEVVEDVLMMEALDIPCGVYWVDRPWAKGRLGYDDFQWDPQRFPQAEKMIGWIRQHRMKFMLWIAPWVMGDMADEAKEKGYALKKTTAGHSWEGDDVVLVDFTNPDAVDFWQKGLVKVLKQGVQAFKMDRSEELVPATRDIRADDGRTMLEVRNDYPVQYAQAAYEACRNVWGDDFLLVPRAGYTHSSRYAAFWGGDIASPAEGLRAAIIAQQRNAVMGYPVWGSDIGGYWGGDIDREVTARWLGFGCFSAIMEVGPTENLAFWSMAKEPHYDAELIAIWRLYAKLHERLMRYSYDCAEQAHQEGTPVVRPLFLMYPNQEQSWQDWQSYMYGPDILVSAIWRKGKQQHTLYLPAGERWIDAWTEKIYKGGREVTVDAPVYKIPIFVRQGSEVDLGDLQSLYDESLRIARDEPNIKQLEKKAFARE